MVKRPEHPPLWSEGLYALREVASNIKNAPAHLRYRKAAERELSFADGKRPRVNFGTVCAMDVSARPIGGQVKLIPLRKAFPPSPQANLIYLVSSALPPDAEAVVKRGKQLGMKLVWNQNGIAYPGCYGNFYPWFNRRMAALRDQADYIVNQSEFSRISAERYLGPSRAPSEICFNPVDVEIFSPRLQSRPTGRWRILAAGTSHALYRTKSAMDTLRALLRRGHDAELILAGEFRWRGAEADVRRESEGLEDRIRILPPFSQDEAPELYRSADVLLHTKYNDPCPTVPIEAMACGLPVVGTASGGMPELVDAKSGVLVPVPQGWTADLAGDPTDLAQAVETVFLDRESYVAAARDRACRLFDVKNWTSRHAEIFQALVG